MLKVKNTKNGVSAFLSGFKTEDIAAKIEACKNGKCECSCDSEIMGKIQNIELLESENGANIVITGDISADKLTPLMKECFLQ